MFGLGRVSDPRKESLENISAIPPNLDEWCLYIDMQHQQYYGLIEVARMVKVSYHRIIYATKMGRLPEPVMLANKRVYTLEDIELIRDYFTRTTCKEKSSCRSASTEGNHSGPSPEVTSDG